MEEGTFSFDDFHVEMGDFEYRQVNRFERIFNVGDGGSWCQRTVVHEGVLYAASLDHNIYAIDALTGKLIWKYKTMGIICLASPTIHDDSLYVGSYDHNMYCLDTGTGRLKWKYGTGGKIVASAHVHENRIYFGSSDYNLYCLDAGTGRLIWKFQTQGEVASTPSIHGNRLFFGSYDHNLYCVDHRTGHLLWKFPTQSHVINYDEKFLIKDGVIYFGSFDNFVRAVDIKSGELLWKYATGSYGGAVSATKFFDGMLLQANREGALHAITTDGKKIWEYRISHLMAGPIVHEDRIYIGTGDYKLHCLDRKGKELWHFDTQGEVWHQSCVWDGKVYFTSWDCYVYCVDTETHDLVWKFRGQGSESYLPPPYDSYELIVKKGPEESKVAEDSRKTYDMGSLKEESTSEYKSRVTYQLSTQYSSKGKYQIDSREEEF